MVWEDAQKPPLTLFVETDPRFHEAFWPDPNAFLTVCLLPAWRDRERRIQVGGTLCPVLCRNMRAVISIMGRWWAELGTPPSIEPARGLKAGRPSSGRSVSLLSCGIDSLATLRWNKLHLPPDHPSSIEAVMFLEFHKEPSQSADEFYTRVARRLPVASRVADDAGVDVVPVVSNIWWLVNDGYFFESHWNGAVLSGSAAFFSKRFHRAYIASGYHAAHLHPCGSHPLIDPLYNSAHFHIEHDNVGMTRLEKTALVADWDVGLQNMRVCQSDVSGGTNCGLCEKCIRSMTTLIALGKLKECRAFPVSDVSVDTLTLVDREYGMIKAEYDAAWYRELIAPLIKVGRGDLAAVIQGFPFIRPNGKSGT